MDFLERGARAFAPAPSVESEGDGAASLARAATREPERVARAKAVVTRLTRDGASCLVMDRDEKRGEALAAAANPSIFVGAYGGGSCHTFAALTAPSASADMVSAKVSACLRAGRGRPQVGEKRERSP